MDDVVKRRVRTDEVVKGSGDNSQCIRWCKGGEFDSLQWMR